MEREKALGATVGPLARELALGNGGISVLPRLYWVPRTQAHAGGVLRDFGDAALTGARLSGWAMPTTDKYRLVGNMTLAGTRGKYKSENEVSR